MKEAKAVIEEKYGVKLEGFKINKMNKLIIDNRTELTDLEAVTLVSKVIDQGRISNDGKQVLLWHRNND